MEKSIQDLYEIIDKVRPGMSRRPEFTSGRGASVSDLDSDRLLQIQRGIKEKFGDDAAKALVVLVQNIKVMACTTFLKELYNLFYNDWKIKKSKNFKAVSDVSFSDEIGAFCTVMGKLNKQNDDTQEIKSHFLRVNGIKPVDNSMDVYGYRKSKY